MAISLRICTKSASIPKQDTILLLYNVTVQVGEGVKTLRSTRLWFSVSHVRVHCFVTAMSSALDNACHARHEMCMQRVRRAIRERGQVDAGPSEDLVDACVSRLTWTLSLEGGTPCAGRMLGPCCRAWNCRKPYDVGGGRFLTMRQSAALETLRPLLHRQHCTDADATEVLDFADRVTQTIRWIFADDFVGNPWKLRDALLAKHFSQRRCGKRLLNADATACPGCPLILRAVKLTPFDVWLRLEDLDDRRAADLP